MRDKPCLTSSDIHKAMAACRAEAEKNRWIVSIAIVDDGGFLLHFDRMDGAAVVTAEVAIGKARTAALTRRPSKFFEPRQGASCVRQFSGWPTHPRRLADHSAQRMRRRHRGLGRRLARGRAGRRSRRE